MTNDAALGGASERTRSTEPVTLARPWSRDPAWWVVTEQELRDLWLAGRGLPLMLAFTVLVSVNSYLVASNQALNFLEQRESVSLTLQVTVAVGGLLVLLGAADAVTGERERGTLETLLLTPASRQGLVVGKMLAALSLWLGAFVLTLPYVWFLGRGVGVVAIAVVSGLLVGTLLALFLVGYGLAVSLIARSNRLSLAVALFILLALYAPTQMPTAAQNGWAGELLLRIDPFTAALHFLSKVIIDGHSMGQEAGWLIGPLTAGILGPVAVVVLAARLGLGAGRNS
jgi:ABC-2 type transport system permease protein